MVGFILPGLATQPQFTDRGIYWGVFWEETRTYSTGRKRHRRFAKAGIGLNRSGFRRCRCAFTRRREIAFICLLAIRSDCSGVTTAEDSRESPSFGTAFKKRAIPSLLAVG